MYNWLEKLKGLDPITPEFTEALYNAFIERMKSEGLLNESEESKTSTQSPKNTRAKPNTTKRNKK